MANRPLAKARRSGVRIGASNLFENPFRQWTPRELLAYTTSKPLIYEPGTNWNYAHNNYVILGLALEKITGKPIPRLLQENILGPLRLRNTADPQTPEIPQPVLHTFTSERREALGIPHSTRFYEESTYWNPSWTHSTRLEPRPSRCGYSSRAE